MRFLPRAQLLKLGPCGQAPTWTRLLRSRRKPFHVTTPDASPGWGVPKTPPSPQGGARRGADEDPAAGRPLPSSTNRAHAALHPGAREQSPRSRHGRPPTRLGDPWAPPRLTRAPPSLFGWPGGAERLPSVTPRRRAPGTCLGSRVPVRRPREAGAALNRRRPPRRPAGRGTRVPTAARGALGWPQPHAPLSCSPPPTVAAANTRAPARRPRCQPQPGRPASPAVPGLPGSAAHGAGSGGGNVNKSGFYSYLTLECRVHLLSARYQTPAAPSRVFSKATCAICVAEPSTRAGALRRRRTQPALAPCAAAPWPPQRYASGAPGPLGRPAQPHLGLISATPAAHPQHPAIHFADAPGVGEPQHRRELHRQAELEEFRSTQIAELYSSALVLF